MATAKKKMRLAFFWADEQVYLDDFRNRYSQKMVEWANEFYGGYGFEIEGYPNHKLQTIPLAHKFCLAKTNGIIADIDDVIHQKELEDIEILEKQIEGIDKQIEGIDKQIDEVNKQIELTVEHIPKMKLYDEVFKLYDKNKLFYEERRKINLSIDTIKAKSGMNYEDDLRRQIGFSMLTVAPKFDALPIVFCKIPFKPKSLLTLKGPPRTGGLTCSPTDIKVNLTGSIPFLHWYNYFIIIDPSFKEPITLAHEMMHTTGKSHPYPQKVVINAEKLFSYKPLKIPPTFNLSEWIAIIMKNKINYDALFRWEPGGLYDGDANYILNYEAQGDMSPAMVTMLDEDVKNLENIFFVK